MDVLDKGLYVRLYKFEFLSPLNQLMEILIVYNESDLLNDETVNLSKTLMMDFYQKKQQKFTYYFH